MLTVNFELLWDYNRITVPIYLYISMWYYLVHPGRLTWNLGTQFWKRKVIFQTIIFRFCLNLRGCYILYAPRNAYLSFLVFCGAANTGEICIPDVMLNYVAEPAAKSVANISAHLKLGKVRQKSWQKLRQQLRQNVWQTFRRI